MADLKVKIGSLVLKNPVMVASGTFGYGEEYSPYIDLNILGAIITKGISLHPIDGNPPPRIWETPSGMLNSIGLQNVGAKAFIKEKLSYLKSFDTKIIVNIFGTTVKEYAKVAERLFATQGVDAIELNISCPNVKKGGMIFGIDPKSTKKVVSAVRKVCGLPLIAKLSPNVTDITEFARIAEGEGADAISLINTLLGLAVDVETRKPRLATITGGLSGPAIKPIALRMIWQVAKAVKVPIIGMGGICSTEDALEFILAGATAIAVGTANFFNPNTASEIIKGINSYMTEKGIGDIKELIGGMYA
ncbi:MAG: dihydroorotate dehydrogenase [Nitrospirae bacterium]|nr:dihydroorotate dehydrogenase [Nitrospirota bacterium]